MKKMFQRIRLVAAREFLVTVSSKGFLFGVLVMPVIGLTLVSVIPKLLNQRGVQVNVEVALIDQSALLVPALRAELQPEMIAARRDAGRREVTEQVAPGAGPMANPMSQSALPEFIVKVLPADTTVDAQKSWLTAANIGKRERRALVRVPSDAVTRSGNGDYGVYEFYAPRNLPEDAEGILHGALRQVLIGERLRAGGFDPDLVKAATAMPRTRTVLVSADGKQQGAQGLNRALPFITDILLFMGVMIGGQSLMTSTVEEKSSRVIEVLLAAVSPLELMWGKLLGQLGVGLVSLAMYVTLGVLALLQFALLGLLDPMLIVYLAVFFLISYLVFGALMLAIGAAVNQMADAQSLMGPVMVLMIVPYILTPVIGRAPDSAIAVAASFIPPVNAFAMLARLASSSPPPVWQVLLSMLAGILGAGAAVWFASKVFRVGLLMHGKPPSLATLVKWARMA
ncbi:MAG: ABC transporter permease [Steroidobacteraceae bacterium]